MVQQMINDSIVYILMTQQKAINNNNIFGEKAINKNVISPLKTGNENWDVFIEEEPIYEKTETVQNTVNNGNSINKNMGPTTKSDNSNDDVFIDDESICIKKNNLL